MRSFSTTHQYYIPEDIEGYVPVNMPLPKLLRRGIVWLMQHSLTPIDFDEMVRQLEFCEKDNRKLCRCGCDGCPHLRLCREIFDARCPKTTMDKEVIFTDRPWCCGSPMRKSGKMRSGSMMKPAFFCRYCHRRIISLDKT
jgi:hypothetical protein